MAGEVENLSGKLGLDTTDFKTAIAAANRELRVIESGFRASAAALDDWAKDATGLEMRVKSLGEAMDIQGAKVAALRAEYERIAAEQGSSSRAAQDLEIKLNKETESLNNMQRELGTSTQALNELQNGSSEAGSAVDELGQQSNETAGQMGGLQTAMGAIGSVATGIATAVAGLAAAVAGVGASVAALVLDATDAAGELVDLSTKTGITTTRLQELAYAGGQLGTSQDTIVGALSRLTRSMGGAGDQWQEYHAALAKAREGGGSLVEIQERMAAVQKGPLASAFSELGVRVTDASGNLRDNEAVFADALTALGGIANESQRDALAMSIFGKSAQELNPLIKAGADEIARLSSEAHEMGAVVSEENVAGLESFGDQLASIQAGLKGAGGTLAAAFTPALAAGAGQVQEYVKSLAGIVSGAGGDFGKMADGIAGLLGQVIGDAAAQGPQLLQAGLSILQGIINAIVTNLPILVTAAVTMITTLVDFLVQNLPMLIQAGVDLVMALVNGILPQLPALVMAAVEMIVTLANGIADAIPQLLPVIAEIIPQVVIALIGALPALIDAAIQIIVALVNGLIVALPILIAYVPQILTALYNALKAADAVLMESARQILISMVAGIQANLPMMIDGARQILISVVSGIQANLPMLIDGANKIITTIVERITALRSQILGIGKAIMQGVWDGISGSIEWLLTKVMGFFGGLVQKIKNLLGIKSPSTVFASIGENMAMGLGAGFAGAFADIENQIGGAVNGLTNDLSSNVSTNAPTAGQPAAAVAAAPSGPIYLTISADQIASNLDLRVLARMVAEEIVWSAQA
jgi:phage-related protein